MSLNIKNERTHALVRELATLRGVSQTEAVEGAVRAQLAALTMPRTPEQISARSLEIGKQLSARLGTDSGADHTAFLYDELGLPR